MRKWYSMLLLAFLCISATCAEANITSKDLQCHKVAKGIEMSFRAMTCCIQLMSSGSGSDSKDVVCDKLVESLSKDLDKSRQMRVFDYCEKRGTKFQACWDKIK